MERLASHKRGLSAHTIMHPTREWWIGIVIAMLIVVATAMWGTFLYVSYDQEFIATEVESTRVPYNADSINQALETYRARLKAFNERVYVAPSVTTETPAPEPEPEPEPKPAVVTPSDGSVVVPAL